jgi:hypothetical protein
MSALEMMAAVTVFSALFLWLPRLVDAMGLPKVLSIRMVNRGELVEPHKLLEVALLMVSSWSVRWCAHHTTNGLLEAVRALSSGVTTISNVEIQATAVFFVAAAHCGSVFSRAFSGVRTVPGYDELGVEHLLRSCRSLLKEEGASRKQRNIARHCIMLLTLVKLIQFADLHAIDAGDLELTYMVLWESIHTRTTDTMYMTHFVSFLHLFMGCKNNGSFLEFLETSRIVSSVIIRGTCVVKRFYVLPSLGFVLRVYCRKFGQFLWECVKSFPGAVWGCVVASLLSLWNAIVLVFNGLRE